MLYKAIHNPQDDDTVQFLGVYVTRWGKEIEPTIAFIEIGYDVEGLCEKLLAALKLVIDTAAQDTPSYLEQFMAEGRGRLGVYLSPEDIATIQAAIAAAETEKESKQ